MRRRQQRLTRIAAPHAPREGAALRSEGAALARSEGAAKDRLVRRREHLTRIMRHLTPQAASRGEGPPHTARAPRELTKRGCHLTCEGAASRGEGAALATKARRGTASCGAGSASRG